MGGTSTIYDVKVKYTLDDKASQGLKSVAANADKAHESVFSLENALKLHTLEKVFHVGKELLIDFNQEMDNLKIGMTTVMQMNMHMPFEKASAAADKLFMTFQDMAKKSPLMTKDFMEMASALAPAVSMAGGGVHKLEKMTQGALTAGLAFNVRPDQMAMDIQEMLAGNVRLTSRTARQLIASQGLDHKEFNDKSAKERAQITEKILTDPAVLKSSERMAHTMAGEVSTLKDNIQIAFGEIGKPLMAEITAQFKKINEWVETHPKLIKQWVTSFSETLQTAFGYLKGVAGWFMDHSDLLMSLAKTFVVFKGASIATNVFKSFAGGVGDLAKTVSSSVSQIKGAFSGSGGSLLGGVGGLIGGLSRAIPALGLFAGAVELVTGLLNSHAEEDKKARDNALSLNEATGDIPGMMSRRNTLKGLIGSTKNDELKQRMITEQEGITQKLFDPETLGTALRKINEASEKGGGVSLKKLANDSTGLLNSNLVSMLPDTFDSKNIEENTKIMQQVDATLKTFQNLPTDLRDEALRYAFPEQFGMPTPKETKAPDENWGGLNNAEVKVTIQKVEVASEDPDRFVFGLVQLADQAIKHKTQSQHTIPGGF